jgi:hypothetical protein
MGDSVSNGKISRTIIYIKIDATYQRTIHQDTNGRRKLRNDDVHGKDAAAKAIAEKREVSRRLTTIYDQRTDMEPSAQSLLFPDIRTHLEQPPWVIQNWITINGPVFMTSVRNVKAKAIQNVRSIRTYFAPR